MDILLSPPVAFLIYLPLAFLIAGFGRALAGPGKPSELKEAPYAGGEEASSEKAVPGYRPFFLIAFFFAILHLGTLILGLGNLTMEIMPYLIGLALVLIIMLLG